MFPEEKEQSWSLYEFIFLEFEQLKHYKYIYARVSILLFIPPE